MNNIRLKYKFMRLHIDFCTFMQLLFRKTFDCASLLQAHWTNFNGPIKMNRISPIYYFGGSGSKIPVIENWN